MSPIGSLRAALPFWVSLLLLPLPILAAVYGGWVFILTPLVGWHVFSIIDAIAGSNTNNPDPDTPTDDLKWYRAITLIWPGVQIVLIFGVIYYMTTSGHLGLGGMLGAMFSVGILSGTIGIVYAHELLHQKNALERWLGDLLLGMVLYSHFRSEHLLVHHTYVGTPRDPVTARYNEGFYRYFLRVLLSCPPSAFGAERAMLARRKLPVWHRRNPFWRYGAIQLAMLVLAFVIGGGVGVLLFAMQAATAILALELTNYIEHYGLTRRHIENGKYEHVKPHHSWNASLRGTNWLLINLQRHSDHHYKPDRRFPLLQTYSPEEAPQLPRGYPLMGMAAMIPRSGAA